MSLVVGAYQQGMVMGRVVVMVVDSDDYLELFPICVREIHSTFVMVVGCLLVPLKFALKGQNRLHQHAHVWAAECTHTLHLLR